jgi:uncharacterized repeat protein (TIGR01451 family)
MRINTIFNKIKNAPKKIIAPVLGLAIALPVAGIVYAAPVAMEGHTKSLNNTTGETQYKDSTSALVDDVVTVQLWYHNREAPNGEVAKNTKVKFSVPDQQGKNQVITGTSSADNANTVTDNTNVLLSMDRAKLDYLEGSAKWRYNKGAMDGDKSCQTGMNFPPERCYATVPISDDVVNNPQGVNLGNTPGCNAFHATVTIQVRVVADVVSVNKFVRHQGEDANAWSTSTEAEPGDNLEYLIRFKNEGNTRLEDIAVGDNLPKYNSYVNGSTNLRNGANPNGIKITSDNITKGGIDVGDYMPGAVGYVWFTAKLDDKHAYEKCGVYDVRNVGVVRPKGMNEFYNTAIVKINVECDEKPEEPKEPIYSCDLLKVDIDKNRKANFTVNATAENGAEIKQYRYDFGDGTEELVTDQASVSHTYAEPGQYAITAKVDVEVDGEIKTAESEDCTAVIDFPKKPEVPPTVVTADQPITPGKLPEAGPGDVLAVFLAVVAASSAAYFVVVRRLSSIV